MPDDVDIGYFSFNIRVKYSLNSDIKN